jgi:hypothetical protein
MTSGTSVSNNTAHDGLIGCLPLRSEVVMLTFELLLVLLIAVNSVASGQTSGQVKTYNIITRGVAQFLWPFSSLVGQ